MKNVLAVLALLFCGCLAFASPADDIANIQNRISTDVAKRADMVQTSNAQDKKADDIKFVYNAYTKAKAQYDSSLQTYTTNVEEVKRGFDLLAPSLENYNQRVNQHNANQCTETCTNGRCDGSCAWYNAEKNQLGNNKQQIENVAAPLRQRAAQLENDKNYLDQTYDKLNTIYQGVQSDVAAWTAKEQQLKADWLANEAEISTLLADLARLKGENNDCLAKIPPACQINPLLDDKCEQMHAACGRMFDGNR